MLTHTSRTLTTATSTTSTTTLWSSELFDHRGGLHSDKTECNEEPAGDASIGGEEDHIHR